MEEVFLKMDGGLVEEGDSEIDPKLEDLVGEHPELVVVH